MNNTTQYEKEITVRDAVINHRLESAGITLWLPGHEHVQILTLKGHLDGVIARHQNYFRTMICDVKTGRASMLSLKADSKIKAVWL